MLAVRATQDVASEHGADPLKDGPEAGMADVEGTATGALNLSITVGQKKADSSFSLYQSVGSSWI